MLNNCILKMIQNELNKDLLINRLSLNFFCEKLCKNLESQKL